MPPNEAVLTALPAPGGGTRVEYEVRARPEEILEEWEALADRAGAPPFRRSGWVLAWGRHFSRAPVKVLGVRRGGRLIALLPFVRRAGALSSPTNFHTPDFGPVTEDRTAAALLFRGLAAQPHRQLSLSFLEEGGEEAAGFLAAARARGDRVLVRPLQRSPYVETSGTDWAGFESRLDARLRADLRRRARRLGEAGEMSFQVADGRADLGPLVEEGFRVESSEWKSRHGTAIESGADTRSFYREIAAWAAERGSLRLAFLRLDGRPIAFQLGLEDAGAYYFLKGGYDVGFRAFAPGKLLVRSMLARTFEIGLGRFEFLGDAEAWKLEWTNRCRGRVAAQAFARGPAGFVGWLGHRYGRPAAKRLAASYHRLVTNPTR